MALPIRTQTWPVASGDITAARNDARTAAQKAFFDAALAGKSTATLAQEAPNDLAPRVSAAQAARTVAATEARAADRLPPPGSIVNILV
ncbi:MAG TPA: hypothetical protein VFE13_16235 [Caulobacteraceae bacterium]|jgi:hypothetical protein|nr:hypothetical protein [Caulobacteraceae bacterium]